MSLNVFGCPLTSVAKCSEKHSDKAKELEKHHHSCGIWVKASYINHSCYQNVRRSFIGDMQIVRATRDLPAGTEMAFWYVLPDSETYKERQEKLRQTWGFQCTCVMCDEEKNTPKKMTKKREALLGDLKAAFESSKPSTAERLLGAVEKSYKPSFAEVPRLVLLDPYLMLTRMYAAETQPEKVISTTLKVLGSLGFVIKGASLPEATNPTNRSFEVERWGLMVDHVIEAWMHLWTAYACVAPQLCAEAKECARTAYKICAGEDITFEENYGKIGRHIG